MIPTWRQFLMSVLLVDLPVSFWMLAVDRQSPVSAAQSVVAWRDTHPQATVISAVFLVSMTIYRVRRDR